MRAELLLAELLEGMESGARGERGERGEGEVRDAKETGAREMR